jgi:hypothetical protein
MPRIVRFSSVWVATRATSASVASYWDQFLVLVFAQLTYRESLRDIEVCLGAMPQRLYHMGLRCGAVARSTLADANERRDWRVFADFAQLLIHEARLLYADEPLPVEIDTTVYAFDSTTIDLCLSLFPWAPFRATKAAIRLHTLLDLRGNIPTFIHITDGLVHDVNVLDLLIPEAGAVYVLDRGYLDFARLLPLSLAGRTVLQMDQATPPNLELLRHVGECRPNAGVDRCLRLRARRDPAETATGRALEPLHFATDRQRDRI